MTIEYEENPFFSLEKLLQMTTCNNCCDRRGRKFHQPTTQPTEQNLPYSDL